MRIKEGFTMREVCGEIVVVPSTIVNFNNLINLNESAAFLWKNLQDRQFSYEDVAGLLVGEYGIDRALALKDAGSFCTKLMKAGVIED